MNLIKQISIENFRSIERETIQDIGTFNVLVGKNSGGKSNVLRALNLFFNGEVEPGKKIDFGRDYFLRDPPSKKKKKISITIKFELPAIFKLRQGLEGLRVLGNEFSITRIWELDQRRNPVDLIKAVTNGNAVPDSSNIARQFLGLISYRYIPNRTIPADLLKDESQSIADSIFARMKGDQHAARLLESLSAAATRMLGNADSAMKLAGSPLGTPRIALGESMGEMLSMSGFQATAQAGGDIQDEDWGAGHQAFFLYLVLHALDTNYSRFFGWKQATIWGVEEPESALHRDLETRLASGLRVWTNDGSSRLQIFVTTHSPIVTMAANSGFWTELSGGQTAVSSVPIPQLTRAAEIRGVTGWVHPILSFPWNPVVLVEGSIDLAVLNHVASLIGSEHLRFLTVPGLDPNERQRGKDGIISYLRKNQGLVQNRPAEAPLLVLFDWDVSDQDLQKAKKAYGDGADRHVLRMDDGHCHELLGTDFKGIERFYPPELLVNAHAAGELVLGVAQNRPYSIAQAQLTGAKGALRDRLLHVDALEQLTPLIKVMRDLEEAARGDSTLQLSLPGFGDHDE